MEDAGPCFVSSHLKSDGESEVVKPLNASVGVDSEVRDLGGGLAARVPFGSMAVFMTPRKPNSLIVTFQLQESREAHRSVTTKNTTGEPAPMVQWHA